MAQTDGRTGQATGRRQGPGARGREAETPRRPSEGAVPAGVWAAAQLPPPPGGAAGGPWRLEVRPGRSQCAESACAAGQRPPGKSELRNHPFPPRGASDAVWSAPVVGVRGLTGLSRAPGDAGGAGVPVPVTQGSSGDTERLRHASTQGHRGPGAARGATLEMAVPPEGGPASAQGHGQRSRTSQGILLLILVQDLRFARHF